MPAGQPYFAWVDQSENTFTSAHLRWDENVFSFSITQSEGDPASMTAVVRRPRNSSGDPVGLLGPGRKIWAWFALDCGPSLFKYFGRLVGVPTSIFEELVTLEFIARPFDVVAQKAALADTLRVLPYYDEVVLDPTRRSDPEVVLEGYSKIWHYSREGPHVLTVSDEIEGEDGLVEFDGASEDGKILYDGLGLTLTSGPVARVDINAEYTWTQQAYGNVDLARYITDRWPNEPPSALGGFKIPPGYITSFTLASSSWPTNGAGIGEGWVVASSSVYEPHHYGVSTFSETRTQDTTFWDGEKVTVTNSVSRSAADVPQGSMYLGSFVTASNLTVTLDENGEMVSYNSSASGALSVLAMYLMQPTLVVAYTAARPCTEQVTLTLFADVQHVLTDPDDGEALVISDIKSVNLNDPLASGEVPIGDPRRRSYVATARGTQSVEHLIALARAQLLKRARVVEITVVPKLSRMPEITLRKNAFLAEPRIGEATGKIIGYTLALDGADGQVKCEVKIGCAIGRGGSAIAAGGTPTYCSVDYVGADYQQFTGRIELFDTSVGYAPPLAAPNDDGIDFLSAIRADDVIDTPLSVQHPPAEQRDAVMSAVWPAKVSDILKEHETKATFKLKSMTRDFSTPYRIQVTDLKVPTGYNLETV